MTNQTLSLLQIDNPNNLDPQSLLRHQIIYLSQPNHLQSWISKIDEIKAINMIYVMGCGRSGTWLLTALMTTYEDLFVLAKELAIEHFGLYQTTASTLVIKRNCDSYLFVERIPSQIKIIYIIRHPYDVLTSHNPVTGKKYHIDPERWLGEMLALQFLIDSKRPNTQIIRYEDMVLNPDLVQVEIATFFGLSIKDPVENIVFTFQAPPEASDAMHGLRKIDQKSIAKFKKDPKKIDYLKVIQPNLEQMLNWVAQEYSYDLTL